MIFSIEHYQTLGDKAHSLRINGEREMSRDATRTFKRCLKHEVCEDDREAAQAAFTQGYRLARCR